jgi:NAD(P)-dependent dehydrogenase (short-subunit alcohol dehydrogenase family)
MTQPLHGRRILVTGGATGIGAAAVEVLSAAGADVGATYHRTPPPDGAGVSWVQCDLRDAAAVDDTVGGAAETLGGLDVLLHAAGLWQPGIPGQITGEEIDFLVDTNIKATIFANQAAYAVMRKDGGGRIINYGSGEAVVGSPISAVYAATKGAVAAWTRSIARAWAAEKVSAIALAPAVQTPGADRLREFLGPEAAKFIDEESGRRFRSAARSGIRSTISGRRWFSCAARDLASSLDS